MRFQINLECPTKSLQARDVLDELSDECAKETHVPLDFIHQAEKGTVTEDKTCYSMCLFKKAGFINDDGELQLDIVKEQVPAVEKEEDRPSSIASIEKCKDLKGKDLCETCFLIHRCYFQNFQHKHK